jgi:SAM-dependent methyltransferase
VNCRHCNAATLLSFLDLGTAPPSNAYLTLTQLSEPEVWYPLRLLVCSQCWLVQTQDYAGRESLFTDDYAYFSSVSSSWLAHAERYVDAMVDRFGLDSGSTVVEVAANDGYLLQFVQRRGIPCYGIEPTLSTAAAARARGIEVIREFFDVELANALANAGRVADLMVANNVLAHVPDINGFVRAFARLLRPDGVATFEFPHLLQMVRCGQFDTAYHEHYSYLSLGTAARILGANGLQLFDVEELPTHGGSLRVFAQRGDRGGRPATAAVERVLREEEAAGMRTSLFYSGFQPVAERIKDEFVAFLGESKRAGRRVVGYGAAAKGNTLLNFAGVRADLLPYIVDRSPGKQGKYMPGSRIPIVSERLLEDDTPDFVVILPWNIVDEVSHQLAPLVERTGARLVVAVPRLHVLEADGAYVHA